jgi:hypothetical protein
MARERHHGGVLAWREGDSNQEALERTRVLMADPQVPAIFEAAFEQEGLFARVDILIRGDAGWWIEEIKASGSVKEGHFLDLAYQWLVLDGCGVRLEGAKLGLVNKEYRWKGGPTDAHRLVISTDVTSEVKGKLKKVVPEAGKLRDTVQGSTGPEAARKPACRECEFHEACWEGKLPETDIVNLPYAKEKAMADLVRRGHTDICSLPSDLSLNDSQRRAVEALCNSESWFSPSLGQALDSIAFPALYLDFEVDCSTVPWVVGTRPYENIPFQFHCEWETEPGVPGEPAAYLWPVLAPEGQDPRPGFVARLAEQVRRAKSVVVYSNYEKQIVASLEDAEVPGAAELLGEFRKKEVDLLEIVKNGVRHPGFGGKFSLKKVLPALCPDFEQGYEGLAVKNGDEAVDAFHRMKSPAVTEAGRHEIARDLLEYCRLDVVAMVEVVKALRLLAP